MVESPAWKDTLKKRGWLDLYQPAEQFAAFLQEDRAKVETTLKEDRAGAVALSGRPTAARLPSFLPNPQCRRQSHAEDLPCP